MWLKWIIINWCINIITILLPEYDKYKINSRRSQRMSYSVVIDNALIAVADISDFLMMNVI